ncbi:MAG TPA: ABC transporter ATP-binding protein [Devosiaceae bacterium]|jgi:subfamily B ATP-binding cassette protein MsbA|nr:ABC transporter ATP-binding protein [Devosiaceae bacterium]
MLGPAAQRPRNTGRSESAGSAPAQADGLRGLIKLLAALIGDNLKFAAALVVVIVIASVAEGVGFSLIVPLLQGMVAGEPDAGAGMVLETIMVLGVQFPPEWRLIGLLGLLVTMFFIKGAALVAVSGMSRWFSNTLRLRWVTFAFESHMGAPYTRVAGQPQGQVVQNIIGETDSAARAIILLIELLARTLQIVVLVGLLLLADWRMTLLIGALTVFAFSLIWGRTRRLSLQSGVERLEIRQSATDIVSESVDRLRSVKLLGLADVRTRLLAKRLRVYRRVDTVFELVKSLPSNVIDLAAVIMGTIVILFATSVLGFQMDSVLPMTALFGVVFMRITSALGYVFSRRMGVITAIPSLRTVHEMLEAPPEQEPGGEPFPDLVDAIVFEDVSLTPEGRGPVLHDLNLSIPATGLTGIVGPSGSGKTTLVDLLVRLREPDDGRIMINGSDLRRFDVRSIRERVGYLGQDPQLFNGTIGENLALGRPTATLEEIRAAAARVGADEFVMAMPHGYDTAVGRGGVSLSGGQRQRLALARELVRNPVIYIFDEPSSALDEVAAAVVKRLLFELAEDHCVIVIAHDLDIISGASSVYRLSDGKALPVTLDASVASPVTESVRNEMIGRT